MKKSLMIFFQKFINFVLLASESFALLQHLEDLERSTAQGGRGPSGCRVQLDCEVHFCVQGSVKQVSVRSATKTKMSIYSWMEMS